MSTAKQPWTSSEHLLWTLLWYGCEGREELIKLWWESCVVLQANECCSWTDKNFMPSASNGKKICGSYANQCSSAKLSEVHMLQAWSGSINYEVHAWKKCIIKLQKTCKNFLKTEVKSCRSTLRYKDEGLSSISQNSHLKNGMVVCTCNPGTLEAEKGGSLCLSA